MFKNAFKISLRMCMEHAQRCIEKYSEMMGISKDIPIKIGRIEDNFHTMPTSFTGGYVATCETSNDSVDIKYVKFDIKTVMRMYVGKFNNLPAPLRMVAYHFAKKNLFDQIEKIIIHEFRHVQQFEFINNKNLAYSAYRYAYKEIEYGYDFLEIDAVQYSYAIMNGMAAKSIDEVFKSHWYEKNKSNYQQVMCDIYMSVVMKAALDSKD